MTGEEIHFRRADKAANKRASGLLFDTDANATVSRLSGLLIGLDVAITDAHGHIWNARWGASCVDHYDRKATRFEKIMLPVKQPTCSAFIGNGRIAVTSAWKGMNDRQKAANPDAGKTIVIDAGADAKFEPLVAR